MSQFPQPISEQIWTAKYRLTTPTPSVRDDLTVEDTWGRIAYACSNSHITHGASGEIVEIDDMDREHNRIFYENALRDFKFLPAGRITAGAGSARNVTLFNCYVMGKVPDDISGIFEMLREAALTMQQGGGIGYDFTPLRPMGSPVRGVDADASGPLSFMDVWDAMCKTIMSAGYRRGAMMATMRCDHPDIEAFIAAKQDKTKLRMFNMSVQATDDFMDAVKNNDTWTLLHKSPPAGTPHDHVSVGGLYTHKVIQARDLWDLIMRSTYDYAEPGVLFIDRINQQNNLWYMEDITATNPCGEQPLPPYGACLLGSINLTKMVEDPFSHTPWINWNQIMKTATIAVRMLDSVIDMSIFPIAKQRDEALRKRRMGVGITGLASMLFMMNMRYDSEGARELAGKIMETITLACYEESIKLAKKYGPCPAVATSEQRQKFIESGFMANMPPYIKEGILIHGIRNSHLTSIAPTGTISLYAGNVSSGIEPIFAAQYTRKILEDDGVTKREETVQDYAVHLLHQVECNTMRPKEDMIKSLTTAQVLVPNDHLKMQAAIQPWIDSSISKTINCPEDISYENFKEIYLKAYAQGCKGCTTYRPNAVTGSVLALESVDEVEPTAVTEPETLVLRHPITEPMDRPKNLTGTTYKLKWDKRSFYVTINDYLDDDGKVIPFEIFINSAEMDSLQWTTALTRMISAVFRRGGNVAFVGEELKRISDPAGGFWTDKKYVPSFVALLGGTIQKHMQGIADNEMLAEAMTEVEFTPHAKYEGEFVPPTKPFPTSEAAFVAKEYPTTGLKCPECHEYALVVSEGCSTCTNCGHSKCG